MCYKGYKHTAESKARMSRTREITTIGAGNGFYGKYHTEEWKQKRRLLYSGEGNPMYGVKRSGTYKPETRHRMGSGWRGKKQPLDLVTRRTATCRGRVKSEETRRKISQSRKASPLCQVVFFKQGKDNPAWNGGTSFEIYGDNFTQELKDEIRARDNYTCQLCFIVENGRRHTCHHIDYCKQHTVTENLITLCTPCNNKVNQNRLFWEAHFTSLLRLKGVIKRRRS